MKTATLSAIVPTLGRSPYLDECLRALREADPGGLEIVVVAQGESSHQIVAAAADRVVRSPANLGFAGGCNLGLAEAQGEYVALVNDDAVVDRPWLATLAGALDGSPGVGAVQGVNLQLAEPARTDGCGIGWNWAWRPVQLGYDAPPIATTATAREIFGVSGTACLYRRSALRDVSAEGAVFDPRLRSYYEDVELAVRLRAAGWRALLVPGARAQHAGSTTSRQYPVELTELLVSNRYLVAARLFGRGFSSRLPLLVARDLVDVIGAVVSGRLRTAGATLRGWRRARRLLPGFAHSGPPGLDRSTLRRFRVRRAGAYR